MNEREREGGGQTAIKTRERRGEGDVEGAHEREDWGRRTWWGRWWAVSECGWIVLYLGDRRTNCGDGSVRSTDDDEGAEQGLSRERMDCTWETG